MTMINVHHLCNQNYNFRVDFGRKPFFTDISGVKHWNSTAFYMCATGYNLQVHQIRPGQNVGPYKLKLNCHNSNGTSLFIMSLNKPNLLILQGCLKCQVVLYTILGLSVKVTTFAANLC